MVRIAVRTSLLLLSLALGLSLARAANDNDVVRYLPESANAVGVIRVREILATPRARQEGWADKQRDQFLAVSSVFPPTAERVVSAWKFRPNVGESVWSVAVVNWPGEVPLSAIAAREGRAVQDIVGKPAVASGRNAYFVKLGPQLLGIVRVDSRQDVARWIRTAEGGSPKLSPYLATVLQSPSQIVLGLDTDEILDPNRVTERLAISPSMKGNPRLIPALSKLLVSMQGVRLDVIIDERTTAEVTLNFRSNVEGLQEYLLPLFLEALNDLGASIEEFESARLKVDGTAVTLSAELSDASLRRIVSLFTLPHPAEEEREVQPQPARASADQQASQRYVRKVNEILDDLGRINRKAKDYAKTATWHDNFAKKIDDLPAAGVDRELLRLGASISSKLRALAASLRGVMVEVNAQQQSVTYNANYDPGFVGVNIWGGVGYRQPTYRVDSNLQQVREAQSAAVARGAQDREAVWGIINDDRAAMAVRLQGITNARVFKKLAVQPCRLCLLRK